jgi:hypothetical protein
MSLARLFAGVAGSVYVVVGLLGLTAGATEAEVMRLLVTGTSLAGSLLDVVLGGLGLAACAGGHGSSTLYARVVGVVLAVVVLALALPQVLMGLHPFGRADVLLHAVFAAVALYVGFARSGLRAAPL